MPAREKFLIVFFAFWLSFLVSPREVIAQVLINEFQVKPDQWIELYNKGEDLVDISGWIIDDDGGTENYVVSSGVVLPPKKCISFQSGKFNWDTSGGDKVRLFDSNTNLVEEYVYNSPPGDSVSIGRAVDGEGDFVVLASPSRDKFNATGENCLVLSPSPTSTPIPTSAPTNTQTQKDYSNIFISEFMAYPESGDEWVELYNDNDFEVDLYGWYIDDIAEGGSTPRQISGTISPKSQKQFSLNTNAYLNNGGDDVRLLNANQVEKDRVSFETTSKGKSWSKGKNGKWCQLDPSPNAPNPECPKEEDSPTSIPTSTPTQKPPSPTPTPTPKPTPTLKIVPTEATKSGEVLGEEEEATVGGFYPLEATGEAKEAKEATSAGNKNSKNKILGGIFIGAGLVAIFGAAFSLWYTKLK